MSKIFLVGDIHLGLGWPNRVDHFFKVSKDYFDQFLFPLMESELSSDDIIILLGDLFDNRDVVPINILNYAQYILERMSKICPVHLLIGNHDLYTKSENDINTSKLYKYIPNVFVYEETTKIEYMGKSILMMPWVEKRKDQSEILMNFSGCDYLFCHSDLNGSKMHLNSVAHKNMNKIDIDEFSGYKNVYSGHIHILQRSKNFTFVGSIHEMDRNDIDNQKGIFILDVITEDEKFIPNNISPNFKKIYIMKEEDIDNLDNVNSKDWIDLFISNSLLINNRKLRRKLESILENMSFASVDYIDDIVKEEKSDDIISESNESSTDNVSFNLEYKDIISDWISNKKWENDKIKDGINREFNEIMKIYEENYKFKS